LKKIFTQNVNKIYQHEVLQKFQEETKLSSKEINEFLKSNNIKLNKNLVHLRIETINEKLQSIPIPKAIYEDRTIVQRNWVTDKTTVKTFRNCINSKERNEVKLKIKDLQKQKYYLETLEAIIELNQSFNVIKQKSNNITAKNKLVKKEVNKLKNKKSYRNKTTDELLHIVSSELNLTYEATKFNYYYKAKKS